MAAPCHAPRPRSSKVLLSDGTTTTTMTTTRTTTTAVEVAVLEEGKGPWSKAPIIRLRERGGARWGGGPGGGAARRKLIIVHFSSAATRCACKTPSFFSPFCRQSPLLLLSLFSSFAFLLASHLCFILSLSSLLSLSVYIRNVAFRPFVVGSPPFEEKLTYTPG